MSGVVNYLLPLVSLAVAFVAVVMLFHMVFPAAAEEATAQEEVEEPVTVSSSNQEVHDYEGVDDPWTTEPFTTGNREFDEQIKAFCDALSVEGYGAKANAQAVYDNVVWNSAFSVRLPDELPAGTDWAMAAARHYFNTGIPEQGQGGEGDFYEFAAVTAYCLRYFGYSDAFAVPILKTASGVQEGSALCLVTDEYGFGCVCDPSLGANGWMLDRDLYTITVEDIDQDLSAVEDLGLNVQRRKQED